MSRAMAIQNMASLRLKRDDRSAVIGAMVATPGYIKDTIENLNGDVLAADREIVSQAGLPGFGSTPNPALEQWWRMVWVPFMSEWSKFRTGHLSTWGNMWGSTWDSAQTWRQKLIDTRRAAEKAGFSFNGPAPASPETGWVKDLLSTMKILLIVVVAGTVAIALVVALRR